MADVGAVQTGSLNDLASLRPGGAAAGQFDFAGVVARLAIETRSMLRVGRDS
ncbi:hypothetical protein [Paraburkholderia sp. PGU19]|uniref:hypothetical protein n=1 Tax=Paraburkholderia sp. PGU19 TaxID=2735434 RepID=UPI0015DB2B74|nr:hypothetical protein [Paraburkholderia sp. PGU19]